jgi:hypothetical protein
VRTGTYRKALIMATNKRVFMHSFHLRVNSRQQKASSSGIPPWGADINSQLRDAEKTIVSPGKPRLANIKCLELPEENFRPGRAKVAPDAYDNRPKGPGLRKVS